MSRRSCGTAKGHDSPGRPGIPGRKAADAAAFAAQAEKLPPDTDWPDPFMAELAYLTIGRNGLFMHAEKEQMGNVRVAAQMYEEVIRRYPDEASLPSLECS